MARAKTKKSFEDSIEALEAIVEQLESGDLSLEAALKAFEEGVKLSHECQKSLSSAEQKIVKLTKLHKDASTVPFHPQEDD